MESDAIVDAIIEAARAMWAAIEPILRDMAKRIHAIYWTLRRAHLIPRQYRDTIMGRKMRRYAFMVARN